MNACMYYGGVKAHPSISGGAQSDTVSKYLWILVYLRIHLRAEEGEETHSVPSSQVVLLSVGHAQGLVLHHLSLDHYRGG